MNILILGYGQIGQALSIQLQQQGHHVTAVSRHFKNVSTIRHLCQDIHTLQLDQNEEFAWVYVIITAKQRTVEDYQHTFIDTAQPVFNALKHHPVQRIIFISSTRVYGENSGQWIDDDTQPHTQDPIGQCLIAAEQLWSAYWQERLTIIRPSGLYQENSVYFTRIAHQTQSIQTKHWTNRIHRQDVVGFLTFLTTVTDICASYILSNQQPTLQHDMINAIRQRDGLNTLNIPVNLTETGKRIKSNRLPQSGYQLRHPYDQSSHDRA